MDNSCFFGNIRRSDVGHYAPGNGNIFGIEDLESYFADLGAGLGDVVNVGLAQSGGREDGE